jgi:hypothetical protein
MPTPPLMSRPYWAKKPTSFQELTDPPHGRTAARMTWAGCARSSSRLVLSAARFDGSGHVAEQLARFRLIWPGNAPERLQQVPPGSPHKVLATRGGSASHRPHAFRSAALPGSQAGALRDNGSVTSTIMNSSRRWSRNASSTELNK